jgi:excisionase family DNA binding protein
MIIVQLDSEQLSNLIQSSVRKALKESLPQTVEQLEQLLTVEQTAEFLNLSVPTIYSKVSKRELPVMKRGKRLYFSRTELLEYLKAGRKKSNAEIEAEAENYLQNKKGLNYAK